ncbi:hypothetical protein ACO1PF_11010 [Alkalibacterium sp. f15]|uniref:hypothetical protein n=1 Tax=Alkalibacterium sp. f15 TaxID=3414029 RepID=UPI003BF7A128
MVNDPMQNRSQGNMVNLPAHKKALKDSGDHKKTGLPKKDDEDIAEDESKPEDYVKFNVEKVDEMKTTNNESKDEK